MIFEFDRLDPPRRFALSVPVPVSCIIPACCNKILAGAQELSVHGDLDYINERRKKNKGRKRSLQPQEISSLKPMAWTRERSE
jgi:hypothetical protein